MKSRVKPIAIDMDEVLFPMIKPLTKFYQHKYNKRLEKPNYSKYLFSKIFNLPDIESKILTYEYYSSKYAHNVKPLSNSFQTLENLSNNFSLYIVTGRQTYDVCKENTEYLIQKHFPNIFDDIIYTNSFSLEGEEISKLDACKYIDSQLFIDDSLDNCKACQTNGIDSIVFGNYNWNKPKNNLELLIPRLDNWKHINALIY